MHARARLLLGEEFLLQRARAGDQRVALLAQRGQVRHLIRHIALVSLDLRSADRHSRQARACTTRAPPCCSPPRAPLPRA
jgi:hypothetical protein